MVSRISKGQRSREQLASMSTFGISLLLDSLCEPVDWGPHLVLGVAMLSLMVNWIVKKMNLK